MTTYRMPALSTEQLRTIASEALADVARLKITTSRNSVELTWNTPEMYPSESNAKGVTTRTVESKTLLNPNASGIQLSRASAILSQVEVRGYFKEAFNKARKS